MSKLLTGYGHFNGSGNFDPNNDFCSDMPLLKFACTRLIDT